MSNCAVRLVLDNQWGRATVTAVPAFNSYFPVDNTKILWRSRYGLTTANTSQQLLFNLPAATAVDTFYIPVPTTATVLVELFAGANQTGALLYSGYQSPGNRVPIGAGKFTVGVHKIGQCERYYGEYRPNSFPSVAAMSGRVTIAQTTATALKIPYVVLGTGWQPDDGASIGAVLAMRQAGETARTRGGSLIPVGAASRWRELSFDLSYITKSERIDLWAKLSASSLHGVLVDMMPADTSDLRAHHLFLASMASPELAYNGSHHNLSPKFTEL